MKISRLIRFCVITTLIVCISSPSYSASKKKAKKAKNEEAVVETTSVTNEEEKEPAAEETVNANEEAPAVTDAEAETEAPAEAQPAASENKTETKKKSKKKSEKEIQKERNNFSGWIDPKGRSIDEVYGSIKLRIRNKIGSFNIAIVDEEAKKTIPVLSTSDEYTTSGFYLKAGKKIIELNKDSSVRKSTWKTDNGAAVGYRIDDLADVIVYFDTFRSSEDFDVDSIKVTVKVTNMSKKKDYFAVKVLLDTILGETDRHHFYDCKNMPVKNEVSYRELEDNYWFLSKNSSGSLQIILAGGECTKTDLVALANYSTLATKNWEPDLLSYRAFDTVLSYNNSAVGITWPRHRLGADEQFTEVFYISTALGDREPSGADFILGIESETESTEKKDSDKKEQTEEVKAEETKQEEQTSNIPPYVPFDVKTITAQQLSPEYIQKLLNRIAALEESDESLDREELILLNAELDAILEALRLQ